MQLIPLELGKSNRDSVRKAREAYLIERGQTLEPHGLNKNDETIRASSYEPGNRAGSVTGTNSVVCSYGKFQPCRPG